MPETELSKKEAEKAGESTDVESAGIEEESVPKKKSRSKTKRSTKPKVKRKRKKEPTYNVDHHPETGAMQLQELLYLRLMNAEKSIRIVERDVQIAKTTVKDFQLQANNQLQILQTKVKEAVDALQVKKVAYMNEVNAIESETGLSLKEWTIDDDRILRPIEESSSTS